LLERRSPPNLSTTRRSDLFRAAAHRFDELLHLADDVVGGIGMGVQKGLSMSKEVPEVSV
jgi:hypothetical protein